MKSALPKATALGSCVIVGEKMERTRFRAGLPEGFGPIDPDAVPRHVAIIMDGNGRWAKERGKARTFGHRAGMERICTVVRASSDIGVDVLTLYAFSTENWKRPRPEVEALFSLLVEFLKREINNLHKNGVKLRVIGDISHIPAAARRAVEAGIEKTKNNTGLVLNIALNYGSRNEMVEAVQHITQEVAGGALEAEHIDEHTISEHLETAGLPDPDLLIRTSGEKRLSNFLLYQLAYAEFVFTEVHWPDFDNQHYYEALCEYAHRNRRFGGV